MNFFFESYLVSLGGAVLSSIVRTRVRLGVRKHMLEKLRNSHNHVSFSEKTKNKNRPFQCAMF